MVKKEPAEKAVRDIRRRTRRRFSAEEKIRIGIEGLRGEESIASLCRRGASASCATYCTVHFAMPSARSFSGSISTLQTRITHDE
jgi:hypothetical protein